MKSEDVKKELKKYASVARKKSNEWFFKTGKGEYGYGDQFIGVSMPNVRAVAKKFAALSYGEIERLLASPIHEERMCALVILIKRAEKEPQERARIFSLYLAHVAQGNINNWDLVDVSAPRAVGLYLREHKNAQKIFNTLVRSDNLWERRVAILATFPFIGANDFSWTLKNAERLLSDTHDLTHKALGWALREVWKKDASLCEAFLKKRYEKLPRTTLRYAIERMPEQKRKAFLKGEF